MDFTGKDNRAAPRAGLDPKDTGHFIKATLGGNPYTFRVINISRGGIGMLIREHQHDALDYFIPGNTLRMDYINPKGCLTVTVEVRHVTRVESGDLDGLHIVGFSISV